MKTYLLKVTVFTFLTMTTLIACNNSPEVKEEKVEEAQVDLDNAKQALIQARIDSANEYEIFKQKSGEKLLDNDRKIADLKADMIKEKKETRDTYEKKLAELEKKNTDLKLRVEKNQETTNDQWESFKHGFNEEMDEVGKAISEMAEENMNKE